MLGPEHFLPNLKCAPIEALRAVIIAFGLK